MIELPDATYEVECVRVEDDVIENPQFGDGDIVRFTFEVQHHVNADGEPIHLDPIANRKLTPKSKLWAWAEACGLTPVVGQDFETEDFIGRHVIAKVKTEKEGDWPKIVDLMAMPTGGTPKGIAAQRDQIAEAMSLLPGIRAQMHEGEMVEFVGLLCGTFPEADSKGQFIPGKVDFDHAGKLLEIVRAKIEELKAVPFG